MMMNANENEPDSYHHRQQQRAHAMARHYLLNAKISSPPVDPTMAMTQQERGWALELKRALHDSERFEATQLSDLEITQHAMAAQGNVVEAMVRIEGLQQFRQEYDIQKPSLEQIMTLVKDFMEQQPGYFLHVDLVTNRNNYSTTQQAVMVSDTGALSQDAAFEASNSKTADENWRICVCGQFLILWAILPTIAAMRQGTLCSVECDGVGWHNIRADYIQRLFEEMFSYLPVKFQCIQVYNTTVVANLLFSLARPFMGQNMRQSVQLGFQIEKSNPEAPRRLSELYLQPTLEAAQQRLLQRIQALVVLRLVKEQQFRL